MLADELKKLKDEKGLTYANSQTNPAFRNPLSLK